MKNYSNAEKLAVYSIYINGDMTQKELAISTKISEKTISTWVIEGGWAAERDALHQSDERIYFRITARIGHTLDEIEACTDVEEEIKLSNKLAIQLSNRRKLIVLGYSEVAKVTSDFLRFASENDLELGKKLVPLMKQFLIQQKPVYAK